MGPSPQQLPQQPSPQLSSIASRSNVLLKMAKELSKLTPPAEVVKEPAQIHRGDDDKE